MDEERQTKADTPEAAEPKLRSAADARRDRYQLSQTVAGQVARARTAGAVPGDDEAARLVNEFHARGGRVTVLPEVTDAPATPANRNTPRTPEPE